MKKLQLFALLVAAITIFSCTSDKTSRVIELSAEEFTLKVVNINDTTATRWTNLNDRPTVVDFYADWCPPCKQIAPILDELSVKYANKVHFYKVNVDNAAEISKALEIVAIPTIYFIPMDGEPVESVGALTIEEIEELIQKIL